MDRETVIKCLEACTGVTDDCAGHTCPYWDFDDSAVDWGCRIQMEKDALELLKEQEEIVRCRDCRHHDDDFPCELHTVDGSAHDDWFCADGVKK